MPVHETFIDEAPVQETFTAFESTTPPNNRNIRVMIAVEEDLGSEHDVLNTLFRFKAFVLRFARLFAFFCNVDLT